MAIETIRISVQGREQLSRLKRYTGIEHWNVLCRWAFCVSLAEPSVPPMSKIPADGSIEMTWKVFAGPYQELMDALLKVRCARDGWDCDETNLATAFRLHLHRGIAFLAAKRDIRNVVDFLESAL